MSPELRRFTHAVLTNGYWAAGDSRIDALRSCREVGGGPALDAYGYTLFYTSSPVIWHVEGGTLKYSVPKDEETPMLIERNYHL